MTTSKIEIRNLTKIYEAQKLALDHLNLTIKEGEIFGFLGPNGAGKTTTIKLLVGMLEASGGSAKILGFDGAKDREKIHQIAGIVTEQAGMYNHLSAIENLSFYGEVFGLDKKESSKRGEELLALLGLREVKKQKLETFSTGMRQRLSLARALMHKPRVLFLDEPTSGLDPESARKVNQIIEDLAKKEGCTIFLCTHQLRYAQEICTSYGLINEGRLLATGTLEELRKMAFKGHKVVIGVDQFLLNRVHQKIKEDLYEVMVEKEEEIPELVEGLVRAGGRVYHVSLEEQSLEEGDLFCSDKEGEPKK